MKEDLHIEPKERYQHLTKRILRGRSYRYADKDHNNIFHCF